MSTWQNCFIYSQDRYTCSLSLGFLLLKLLDLVGSWLLEFNGNLVSGKLLVGMGHCLNLILHSVLVHWVEEDTLSGSLGEGNSSLASSNGGWNNNVIEESLLDGLKSSGSWSLLGGVSFL